MGDQFKAKVVASESISQPKQIAQRTVSLMDFYEIEEDEVFVDMFGEGAKTVKELALAGVDVDGVNTGEIAEDETRFKNIRAETNFRARNWCRQGGELVNHKGWQEAFGIKYIRSLGRYGKIQIMPKRKMLKEGIKSPDHIDGLALTFVEDDEEMQRASVDYEQEEESGDFDRHAVI